MNYNFYMKPFIKICGITNQKDLDSICIEDIDAIGFNLYLNSKRYVQLSDVKKMLVDMNQNIPIFFIFVNEDPDIVNQCLSQFPDAIPQFHGEESGDYCSSFKRDYVKALRINSETELKKVNQDYKDAKMLILDSYDDDHYGGTGKTFDLSLIKNKIDLPFLLAGGIDKDNFHQALNLKNCIGIDVCSSVEEKPGYKNHAQVKSLVEKVRSYYV